VLPATGAWLAVLLGLSETPARLESLEMPSVFTHASSQIEGKRSGALPRRFCLEGGMLLWGAQTAPANDESATR